MEGEVGATLRAVADKLRAMSAEDFRRSLVDAGILDSQGLLTPPYAGPGDAS
jgi:hypothetical protein